MDTIPVPATPTDARHTPGPWKHEPATQARYAYIVLTEDFDEDEGKGTVLCRVSDGLPESDARLIAAAPDLLAACEEIIEHGTDDWDARVRTMRAAIAKAKGGAA